MGDQSGLILCDTMVFNLLGSSFHGIFQARIQSGLPFPLPGDLLNLLNLLSPTLTGKLFTILPPGKPLLGCGQGGGL